jgi:hypothetical protein
VPLASSLLHVYPSDCVHSGAEHRASEQLLGMLRHSIDLAFPRSIEQIVMGDGI